MSRRDDLRSLCTDARIGRSHPDPGAADRLWDAALFTPQANHTTEREDHRRWRRAVVPRFGAPRMEEPRRQAQELLTQLLDTVTAAGPPTDLHARLAEPFSARLNFDVLGIPREDHARMRSWSDDMRAGNDRRRAHAAHAAITAHLDHLLERKREQPADDALSDLVTARDSDGPLTRDQALEGACHLFFGGYETLAARVSYGVLALLTHPDQYRALAQQSAPARGAVEEILRYAVPGGSWIPRYALADINYHGTHIRAGDLVVFHIQSANRDENAFPGAHLFDITRTPNPHVAFGHGTFHCIGASLARLALSTLVETLPTRLPQLRLADDPATLPTDDNKITGGLLGLPVTW
ncbi:cytochrome P450 [Streptomyces buecherae]|uniref:Cytochrome P450 n=1 Tax=Streptomyces buecherae TaxID=2763006 RepID=A0A7H8NGJ5_9ACTN|nr:cytochrome P450 [Streptomyces buecherae]QKW53634.1 cytochrome P450 [Streptomyces buecherae]